MDYTFDHFKYDHRERMDKADKQRRAEEIKDDPNLPRRGVRGKRRRN